MSIPSYDDSPEFPDGDARELAESVWARLLLSSPDAMRMMSEMTALTMRETLRHCLLPRREFYEKAAADADLKPALRERAADRVAFINELLRNFGADTAESAKTELH